MLTLISFILFLFTVAALLRRSKPNVLEEIPGPKKLPLIGNLHLLLSKSPPHHIFRDLAVKHGPLMRLQLGKVPSIFVSSVEVATQVLRTHDAVFANRPPALAAAPFTYNGTDIGFSPYAEYWRQLRKICSLELLSARRVTCFRPIREEEIGNVAKWIASNEGSPVNLTERVFRSSFDITITASIGKQAEEKLKLVSAVKGILSIVSGFSLADLYPSITILPLITGLNFKLQRVFMKTDRILESIVNQHRLPNAIERPEDLVDVLLKYQREDAKFRLTTNNIKAVVMDMFLAGGETSAAVVEWVMSELIRNPNALKKAKDEVRKLFDDKGYVDEEKFNELKYFKLVIKETLRLHPPLTILVPRQSSERCEINGYEIPANTVVIVNAWALGRDPKYWKDAEKFKPERFEEESSCIDFKGYNLELIPFGAGRRMCPGMLFGMANVEFSMAMLLYHFDWEMPNGMKNHELDMTEAFGASVRRKHELLLIPTLKRPLLLNA